VRVIVTAPAKVNLYLAVGARRPDGYHDIETVMQALELHDTLRIEPAEAFDLTCEPGLGVPAEANLVARAARSLGEALGREPAFAMHLTKRIPAGAGLGGGSADAAAALAGLARLWDLPAGDPLLEECAAALGADVPFFLHGGCALMGGRGDKLVRRLPSSRLHLALVNPGVPIETRAAYAALDASPPPPPPGSDAMLAALDSGDPAVVAGTLYDAMTSAAVSLAPVVADALAWVSTCDGVLGTCMAGSGSTVFGVFGDASSADEAAAGALARGWWSAATRTLEGGVEVLEEKGRS
jgi:4-diphosphocytidyl-2-C-methyl-D-erythritol kinase